jgi:hypothetical protein
MNFSDTSWHCVHWNYSGERSVRHVRLPLAIIALQQGAIDTSIRHTMTNLEHPLEVWPGAERLHALKRSGQRQGEFLGRSIQKHTEQAGIGIILRRRHITHHHVEFPGLSWISTPYRTVARNEKRQCSRIMADTV